MSLASPEVGRRSARRVSFARLAAAAPVVTVVAGLALVYLAEASGHHSPTLFSDELQWTQYARGIADHGFASIRGQRVSFQSLYVYLIAPAWRLGGTGASYDLVKALNVLYMTAAAAPAYLLARRLVSKPAAVLVAAASIAIPAMVYSLYILTEVVGYPWAVLCSWLIVEALTLRTRRFVAAAVIASLLAPLFRAELVVMPLAFAAAAFVLWWRSPSARRLRGPSWVRGDTIGLALLAFGLFVVAQRVLLHSPASEWRIATDLTSHIGLHVIWAAGALAIGLGVLPVVAGLTGLVPRRGERLLPHDEPFIALCVCLFALLALYTGIKGAYNEVTFSTRIDERNLFYGAPLLFVGSAIALERRRIRLDALAASAVFAAYAIVKTPIQLAFPYFDAPGFSVAALANRHWAWSATQIEHALLVTLAVSVVVLLAVRYRPRVAGGRAALAAVALLVIAWNLAGEITAAVGANDTARTYVRQPAAAAGLDPAGDRRAHRHLPRPGDHVRRRAPHEPARVLEPGDRSRVDDRRFADLPRPDVHAPSGRARRDALEPAGNAVPAGRQRHRPRGHAGGEARGAAAVPARRADPPAPGARGSRRGRLDADVLRLRPLLRAAPRDARGRPLAHLVLPTPVGRPARAARQGHRRRARARDAQRPAGPAAARQDVGDEEHRRPELPPQAAPDPRRPRAVARRGAARPHVQALRLRALRHQGARRHDRLPLHPREGLRVTGSGIAARLPLDRMARAVRAAGAGAERLHARVEAVRPVFVLAPLVVIQLAVAAALARAAQHEGWVWPLPRRAGADWSSAWDLGHLWASAASTGYGFAVLFWPLARAAGSDFAAVAPGFVVVQTIVGGAIVVLALYGIGSRIAGRSFGYLAALAWALAPLLSLAWVYERRSSFEGVAYEGFRHQVRDQAVPSALGLTASAPYLALVALTVATWLLVRCLDTGSWRDLLLAALVTGFAIGVEPQCVLYAAGPVLALLLARRPRQALAFLAALAPALVTVVLWQSQAGHVGGFGPSFAWSELRLGLVNLKAAGFSLLLLEWIAVAGIFALVRKAPAKGVLVATWFVGVFAAALGRAPVRDLGALVLAEPGYPAFVLVTAALVLLVPGLGRRRRGPAAAEAPFAVTRGVAAAALLLALYPLVLVALAGRVP